MHVDSRRFQRSKPRSRVQSLHRAAGPAGSATHGVPRGSRFGAASGWDGGPQVAHAAGQTAYRAISHGRSAGHSSSRAIGGDARPMLTQAVLYERLNRAFLVLRRSSNTGRELRPTAGFSPAAGLIYTAMSTLDNADALRVVSHDGSAKEVTSVVAWNRRQHWAVLSGAADVDVQPIAAADATRVGTRCFSLDSTPATGLVLSECSITGQNTQGTGPPLTATFATGGGAPGAPVLNEFGELIGLVGDLGRTGEGTITYRPGQSILAIPIDPYALSMSMQPLRL